MKIFTTKDSNSSLKLLDQEKNVIGELLFSFINGLNDKIYFDDRMYRIKHSGFLWYDKSLIDLNENIILKIDTEKNRLFYFGKNTEFFTIRYKGWWNQKHILYKDDELQLTINYKQKFFGTNNFTVRVENNFDNNLITMFLLYLFNFQISAP
ncbi:hypothetical protein [Frigoriflavimonas asaccharolytica]|uniref:Uncharacterized protein n=1 Tax=Frigoriflavimonas asaccharolytica TaxID=2735899 RepID=A0A8J8K7M1_9FLAO|nr:hypothetical protein [Frigoriflavimonas asaccharolytica]NRS91621.1 hypothetical protein [Frigoriflavimonas asaccharolytica]